VINFYPFIHKKRMLQLNKGPYILLLRITKFMENKHFLKYLFEVFRRKFFLLDG